MKATKILMLMAVLTASVAFCNAQNTGEVRIITRADGSVIKTGDYQRSDVNVCAAAPQYSGNVRASNLPTKVDLRKYMPPIEDQGSIGSCTANSCAGAYEYLIKRNEELDYDISRLFLYYNSRCYKGEQNVDRGAVLNFVLQSLNETGVCSEETWPYNTNRIYEKPPQAAYNEAQNRTIRDFEYVPTDLDTWKSVLADGYPIIFAVYLYPDFWRPRHGRIPMPRPNDSNQGGHAMLCVGYSDPDRVFIVRNSWGTQYGDKGYCYIPYDYVMNPNYNLNDSWVIYDVTPLTTEDAEETWSDDEGSLFVDMEDEFSNMSDEDWAAMCDECGDYDIIFRIATVYNVAYGEHTYDPEDPEGQMAAQKLQRFCDMFDIDYSPEKVLQYAEDVWLQEEDEDGRDFGSEFMDESIDIMSRYFSAGARATIAADMFEIAGADGEVSDDEKEYIDTYVSDWINNELAATYMADFYANRADDDDSDDDSDDKDNSDENSASDAQDSDDWLVDIITGGLCIMGPLAVIALLIFIIVKKRKNKKQQ